MLSEDQIRKYKACVGDVVEIDQYHTVLEWLLRRKHKATVTGIWDFPDIGVTTYLLSTNEKYGGKPLNQHIADNLILKVKKCVNDYSHGKTDSASE